MLLVGLVVARVLVRRSWDKRVSELCYAAPQLIAEPLILSNAEWKMRLAGVPHFRDYPAPDAIVVREPSIYLVWELPLICSVPPSYRTSWDSYILEFTIAPSGKMVAKCHHGSD
jgi:hypothetical protein